jgi:hypothetical protein
MSVGREFHACGPAYKKNPSSPNLVRRRDVSNKSLAADRRLYLVSREEMCAMQSDKYVDRTLTCFNTKHKGAKFRMYTFNDSKGY